MTNLVTHKILCEHLGENSDTPRDPVAVWTGPGMTFRGEVVNLEAEVSRCLNWDDDRPVKIKRWNVIEVKLPDWLTPGEWIPHRVEWKFAWGLGVDVNWPEAWQRSLMKDIKNPAQRLAVAKLLKTKNFRSPFRADLRKQLEEWLNLPTEKRKYPSPFSRGQWEALLDRYTCLEAQNRDTGLYRNNRACLPCFTQEAV